MKCYGPQHWWPARTPFEVIIGAILTQNTAWTNVEKAIRNLKREKLLSVQRLSRAGAGTVASCLKPAGYFNVKTRRLKNFLTFLNQKFEGRLENLFSEAMPVLKQKLLAVNGIGHETADSIILYAARKPVFVVDAYTIRIFSRVGVLKETDHYEKIQNYFTGHLPSSERLFNEYHALIVKLAKECCRKKPLCAKCPLLNGCAFAKKPRLILN
jgi:endonuclease-3 related protein